MTLLYKILIQYQTFMIIALWTGKWVVQTVHLFNEEVCSLGWNKLRNSRLIILLAANYYKRAKCWALLFADELHASLFWETFVIPSNRVKVSALDNKDYYLMIESYSKRQWVYVHIITYFGTHFKLLKVEKFITWNLSLVQ